MKNSKIYTYFFIMVLVASNIVMIIGYLNNTDRLNSVKKENIALEATNERLWEGIITTAHQKDIMRELGLDIVDAVRDENYNNVETSKTLSGTLTETYLGYQVLLSNGTILFVQGYGVAVSDGGGHTAWRIVPGALIQKLVTSEDES